MDTSLTPIMQPVRADHVSETSVADEVVLYDAARQRAFTLNPSAASVWSRCDGTRRVVDIVAELADMFAASRGELERDVMAVLERLRGQELIEVNDE